MADAINVNIEFPNEMLDQIKRRSKSLQFHDVQFYVRWLIAKDALPESDAANLELALVYEGMNSGGERVADEAFYRELNERLDRIIAEKAAARVARAAG